ncbi:MAG TPA: chromosomal replication initiator protein DnaA [Bryobacterales bacterium]|nr:chromosomal replication initiator protein DnaA [Bryobacterales bacterium]
MNAWEQILRQLQHQVSPESFHNWLEPARFSHIEGRSLFVAVPNSSAKSWLETEYQNRILETARQLAMDFQNVIFIADDGAGAPAGAAPSPAAAQAQFNFDSANPFNPKYTFESFVVGSCNQFAHAAARAVATNPSRMYNPLYLYGGVGMGKTHLMQAIGRELKSHYREMKVIYISSEQFINEMVSSLRYDRMTSFRERFRAVDALLVDDIQTLGNKERTQEEFFHTFNTLYELQKQVVISSDCPPKDIPGLVDRLRSRFEWGLIADIQPPDLETKMAILDRKAEDEGTQLPEDVRAFMATKMKGNVRELEGALIRLIALASLTGAEINISMAQQALKSIITQGERKITIEMIQKVVSDEFDLKPGQLKEKTNAQKISFPRQIAMYLVKELTPASLPEIGRAFSGKHHTTVLHSVKKIEALRRKDSDLNRTIHKLLDSFN